MSRVKLGDALFSIGIAEQLERNPVRQRLLLEFVTRPWGSIWPPWFFAPTRLQVAIEEYYEERAAIGEYERDMTRDDSQLAALELVIDAMRRAGVWPEWFDVENYNKSRERIKRRLGLK